MIFIRLNMQNSTEKYPYVIITIGFR